MGSTVTAHAPCSYLNRGSGPRQCEVWHRSFVSRASTTLTTRVRTSLVVARWVILAATTTLALASGTVTVQAAVPTIAALAVVAVLGSIPIDVSYIARWQPVGEAVLVAAVLAAGALPVAPMTPNFLVPALSAGIMAGATAAVLATGLPSAILIVTATASSIDDEDFGEIARFGLLVLGVALLGAWIRRLLEDRPGAAEAREQASYESAYQLLSRLRVVSRRLSQGLEPASLAEAALESVTESLAAERGVLVVASDNGLFVPLATHGSPSVALPEETIREVWASQEVHTSSLEDSSGHLVAIPLRAGSRSVGVLAVTASSEVSTEAVERAERLAGEAALRLDTALLFDEVRSLATTEERRRLAREIHDGIAQDVASLGYQVDELVETADTAHREPLVALRSDLGRLVSELRHSIFDLRSEVAPTGLGTAVADYVQATGHRNGALTVHLVLDESPHRLRRDVEEELLRIVQEAVTNSRKHAHASNLWVTCRVHPPTAELRVEDDGEGLRPGRSDSYGLSVMRERATRIGARLSIRPREQGGTVVHVRYGEPPS
jgi:signal transduction histidine kinase